MQIKFQRKQATQVASELLTLSRTVRRMEYEMEDIRRTLQRDNLFHSCVKEIQAQEESAYLLSKRLALFSNALNEIARLYEKTETRNAERLEGEGGVYLSVAHGVVYQSAEDTHMRMERILH